ncbi:MAG: hypothetical protein EOP05_17710, partial [Proteobacteria bacterium]
MRSLLIVITTLLTMSLGSAAFAKEQAIELSDGSEIVVNLQQDSKSTGGEVFVLLNGLVYELNRWDQVA